MSEQFLWVEKYRPKKIADCILPADLKNYFAFIAKKGEMQNLLLSGSAGTIVTGKQIGRAHV